MYKVRLKDMLKELNRWTVLYMPVSDAWHKRFTYALHNKDVIELYLAVLPEDTGEQIARWTEEMEELDKGWKKRRSIRTSIDSLFEDFLAKKMDMETLVKKHRKAVRE